MKAKSAAIAGIIVCAGLSAPQLKKALRPLGVYALAGGMLAYEAVCRAGELSAGVVMEAFTKVERKFERVLIKKSADKLTGVLIEGYKRRSNSSGRSYVHPGTWKAGL